MAELDKIYVSDTTKEIDLEFEGVKISIEIKPLSWSRKNQILSGCFTYGNDSQMKFNFDKYIKDMLCAMIVKAPWGETTHIFLSKIKPEFGAMLEKLVPRAFEEGVTGDFFVKGQEPL